MTSSRPLNSLSHSINARSSQVFTDRCEAGRVVAQEIGRHPLLSDTLILALPRSGVPVAREISSKFGLALDVFLVRKITMPTLPDVIAGTVTSGEIHQVDPPFQGDPDFLREAISRETAELLRREQAYRLSLPAQTIANRAVILVDDGLTTGLTMRAATVSLRQLGASRITIAVPVGSANTCSQLEAVADSVVCTRMPKSLTSVRGWYRDYSPVLDDEIRAVLAASFGSSNARAYRA